MGAMTRSDTVDLARIASHLLQLNEKAGLYRELRESWSPLSRGGVVAVSGEEAFLGRLETRLREAHDGLRALASDAKAMADPEAPLAKLEEALDAIEWDLVEETRTTLAAKAVEQEKIIADLKARVDRWRERVDTFASVIATAREAHAPVVQEARRWKELDDRVSTAERYLRDKEYRLLPETEPIAKDDTLSAEIDELIASVRQKQQNAAQFAHQADLLLLQSPLDTRKRFEYTVLLRTPSEPGSHGINIQGSSTIAAADRTLMEEALGRVTAAIGRTRQFTSRNLEAAGPVESTPSAPPSTDQSTTDALKNLIVDDDGEWVPSDPSQLIRSVGDLMYRLFMPEQMQQYLGEAPCSITVTTNDLELPWELMVHRGEFICLGRPVARMPMGQVFPRFEMRTPGPVRKLRFLLIYADPKQNLPSAEAEVRAIEESLRQTWKDKIEVEVLDRVNASSRRLNAVLLGGRYDVIHYAGHAAFDEHNPDLSGLLLEGEEVFFAQKIRRLLEGRPLVFLNACEAARTANEQQADPQSRVEYLLKRPAEGLASAFIYGGALACIGPLWSVYDKPAAEFAVSCYNKVLEGYMIGEAMRLARHESRKAHPDHITWAAFVLYGDPTFRLVQ